MIYGLPVALIFIGGIVFLFSTIFAGIAAAETETGDPSIFASLLPLFGSLGFMILFTVGLGLSLVIGVFVPVVTAHVVATDDFTAAFRLKECWAIFRANLTGFVISYVLVLAFGLILGFALQILYFTIVGCCFLPFIFPAVTFYLTLIWYVLYARAYRVGVEQLQMQSTSVG